MAGAINGDTAMDLDDDLDMDVDAMPAEVAAALSTRATKALEGPGPADACCAAAFESRADPAAASLVWRPRPDGTIDLPPTGAVMDDADDPGEDDVNMLQVDEEEVDDDVTAVGGDILGVGPTWGTVGGDPTSNLGRLGPELMQHLTGGDGADDGQHAAAAAGMAIPDYTPSPEQPAVTLPSTARPDASQPPAVVPGGGGTAAAAGAAGGERPASTISTLAPAADSGASGGGGVSAGVLGVSGGSLSEGDGDVRGITGQVVDEDADDLPLGFSRTGVAADAAATGLTEDEGGVAHTAAGGEDGGGASRVGQLGDISAAGGAAGGPTAGGGDGEGLSGDEGVVGEYGPDEVDGLQPGALRQEGGDFLPAEYVRHRSRGQAGIDPDPRQRPDPDPAGGLRSLLDTQPDAAAAVAAIEGLEAGAASTAVVLRVVVGGTDVDASSSSHPVRKDDFAMGGLAMPGLTGLLAVSPAFAANGVSFSVPNNGASLSSPVHVEMKVQGLQVKPAAEGLVPGTGHFHIYVDVPKAEQQEEGEAIPFDDLHKHYGKGQTAADLELSPGKHTLTLQFANALHESYGNKWNSSITVNVP